MTPTGPVWRGSPREGRACKAARQSRLFSVSGSTGTYFRKPAGEFER